MRNVLIAMILVATMALAAFAILMGYLHDYSALLAMGSFTAGWIAAMIRMSFDARVRAAFTKKP